MTDDELRQVEATVRAINPGAEIVHSERGRVPLSAVLGTAVPPERVPDDEGLRAHLKSLWHPAYGDRRQEIVIIGVDLDEAALRAGFDGCLLTDDELETPETWGVLEHPFPWPAKAS